MKKNLPRCYDYSTLTHLYNLKPAVREEQGMHERRFSGDMNRLRSPERVARMEVERVVDLCLQDLEGAQSVLDIGMGTALFGEQFARRGLKVGGADASPEMVQAAAQFIPEADLRHAEAEQLPFADGAFDLAFMGLVLHETDDPLAALREAKRVTTRRVMVLEWPYEVQEFGPGMEERLPPEKVEELARKAGFTTVVVTRLENLSLYRLEK
jgi:ubiquinone/menaquinone biosynthesis C-methylase UbiE